MRDLGIILLDKRINFVIESHHGKLTNHQINTVFGKNGVKKWLEEQKKRSYCNRF
jgi:hypothetical protein